MTAKAHLIGHKIFKSTIDYPRELAIAVNNGKEVEYKYELEIKAEDLPDGDILVVNVSGSASASFKRETGEEITFNIVSVDVEGGFRTEYSDCTPEEKEHLMYVNAPAILLPYLRAFLTTIMAQAGLPLLYFPVHNLIDDFNKKKASKEADQIKFTKFI